MATTLALASCQTDDIMDNHPGSAQNANNAIRFDGEAGKITRVKDKKDAADLLKNNFVVYGTKIVNGTTSAVYNCYNVKYQTNSNNSITNTKGWEYVDVEKNPLNTGSSQSIKYWDYSASQYDFVAFSFGEATQGTEAKTTDDTDTSNDNKVIAKIETDNDNSDKFKQLILTGKASEVAKCYVADRVTATPQTTTEGLSSESGSSYVTSNYKDAVTFNFRTMMTKVQLNIYETIAGYSVKNVQFYSSNSNEATKSGTPTLFTEAGDKIPVADDKVNVTITFNDGTSEGQTEKNLAKFAWSGTTNKSNITFGTLTNPAKSSSARLNTRGDTDTDTDTNTNEFLGTTSDSPSKSTQIVTIPVNLEDGLNLKVDYTLVSDDGSDETITVKGANVKIKSDFTNWKENTAYTYIFHISKDTNGNTGETTNPAGLFPITFDAVVTETGNGESHEEEIKDASSSDSGITQN